MPCCAAINCSIKDTKEVRRKGYTFHRFPHKEPERLQKWLQNLRRKNYTPSPTAVLCSAHFEEHCFYRWGKQKTLEPDAVPTKFDFRKCSQKDSKLPRKPPKPRTLEATPYNCAKEESSSAETCPEAKLTTESLVGPSADHTYHVSVASPRKLKRRLEESSARNADLRKKLTVSLQKVRRLEEKIMTLKEEQGLVSRECADILDRFSGASRQILQRALNDKPAKKEAYPEELNRRHLP